MNPPPERTEKSFSPTESQLIELRKRVEHLRDVSALADTVAQAIIRAARSVFLEPPTFLTEEESKVVARLRRSIVGLLESEEFQTCRGFAEGLYTRALQEYYDAKAALKAEVRE